MPSFAKAVACAGPLGIMQVQKAAEGCFVGGQVPVPVSKPVPEPVSTKVSATVFLKKWLDWPPLWTALGLGLIWVLSFVPILGFGVFGPGLGLASGALGLLLMGRAAYQMWRLKTTVNPRGMPQVLVTDGVFALSRNPIYLGDALVLLAATFWADTVLGFVVVAGFVWVINQRFIGVEEERLASIFGDQAAEWFNRVRRWI